MRGAAFEKSGADYLDMDVVPYSGSNARFGYGDVRDSVWLGEFKNITPSIDGKVTIRYEWLDKNKKRASDIGRLSFLAWMPCGKPTKYIILDEDTFSKLSNVSFDVEVPKKSCKAVNLILNINDKWFKRMTHKCGTARLIFGDDSWFMMRMEYFKSLINMRGLKGKRSEI